MSNPNPNITWTPSGTVINGTSIDASSATISCAGLSINNSSPNISAVDSTQISDSETSIPTSSVINSFISNAGIGEPFQFYSLSSDEITAAGLPAGVGEGNAFGIRFWNKNKETPSQSSYIAIVWYYSSDGTNKGSEIISVTNQIYPWSKSN